MATCTVGVDLTTPSPSSSSTVIYRFKQSIDTFLQNVRACAQNQQPHSQTSSNSTPGSTTAAWLIAHVESLAGDLGANVRDLEESFGGLERKVVEQRIVMEALEEERRCLQNKIDEFICKVQNPTTPHTKKKNFFIRRKRVGSFSSDGGGDQVYLTLKIVY